MSENERSPKQIVFGQVFYPYSDKENGMFVVLNTKLWKGYISAAGASKELIDGIEVWRLGIPGTFELKAVDNFQDIWPKQKVIDASIGHWKNEALKKEVKQMINNYSTQPPIDLSQ